MGRFAGAGVGPPLPKLAGMHLAGAGPLRPRLAGAGPLRRGFAYPALTPRLAGAGDWAPWALDHCDSVGSARAWPAK